jgi:hypothetical protein
MMEGFNLPLSQRGIGRCTEAGGFVPHMRDIAESFSKGLLEGKPQSPQPPFSKGECLSGKDAHESSLVDGSTSDKKRCQRNEERR